MAQKHLELTKAGDDFLIKINTPTGRMSLFFDHPQFKWSDAVDLKKINHVTSGALSLVPLFKKNLYILEELDINGNKSQNFIYASDEISQLLGQQSYSKWLKEHIIEFFTKSISVVFLFLYLLYDIFYMRFFNTVDTLYALNFITGSICVVFAAAHYVFYSSKTKSSFLRFCFKTELIIFLVTGTMTNLHIYNNPMIYSLNI